MHVPPAVVDASTLNQFLHDAFPNSPRSYRVTAVTAVGARLEMRAGPEHERPGGTVSGPTLMGLADGAAWIATLSRAGIVPLAVTTTLTINFVAKPEIDDLAAEAELLRLGPRSSLTEVRITQHEGRTLVAQASVGYSIPAGDGASQEGR